MNNSRFILVYFLMLVLQLILTKCCQIGPFLYISLLPAMIFCMPTTRRTSFVMLIAFLSGLLVDALADGPLGLNALALIPCAFIQKPLVGFFIDKDVVERGYSFSFHQFGYIKVGLALIIEVFLFFTLYVLFDGAGERSAGFNAAKIFVSSLISFIFCMVATGVLSPRQKR